jgi:RHS repeat-associated protein
VTSKYIYDAWNLVAEVDGANNLVRSYIWGNDLSGSLQGAGGVGGLLAVKPLSGAAHFAAYDGNGNVSALVDGSTGSISAQYEYGPFGELIRASGPMAANPLRFSTKYADDETDFIYYGYRFYNPSTGRWPNRDPIGEKGGLNLYVFAHNTPINAFDPDGRFTYYPNQPASQIPRVRTGVYVCSQGIHMYVAYAGAAWGLYPEDGESIGNIASGRGIVYDENRLETDTCVEWQLDSCLYGIREFQSCVYKRYHNDVNRGGHRYSIVFHNCWHYVAEVILGCQAQALRAKWLP